MRWVKLTRGEALLLEACCRKVEIDDEEIVKAYEPIYRGSSQNKKGSAMVVMRHLILKLSTVGVKLERITRLGRASKAKYKLAKSEVDYCRFLLTQQGLPNSKGKSQ